MKLFFEQDEYEFPNKNKSKADRRHRDISKAIRRRNLNKALSNDGRLWYNNLHQYSKNKIHCSCLMCAFNGKRNGRVIFRRETTQDKRNRIGMDYREMEYKKFAI